MYCFSGPSPLLLPPASAGPSDLPRGDCLGESGSRWTMPQAESGPAADASAVVPAVAVTESQIHIRRLVFFSRKNHGSIKRNTLTSYLGCLLLLVFTTYVGKIPLDYITNGMVRLAGLGHLISSIFIHSAHHISKINDNGKKQMCRNIFRL